MALRRKKNGKRALANRELWALRLTWLSLVIYGEYFVFSWSTGSCQWPSPPSIENEDATPFHVMLVADPQILDKRSYPGRHWMLRWLGEKITDNFIRKSWRMAMRKDPKSVIFLGNMLDSGILTTEKEEHTAHVERFKTLFFTPSSLPVYFMPGNHDLGLFTPKEQTSRDRFKANFGEINWEVVLGNHSIVAIDSMGILQERRSKANTRLHELTPISGGAMDFVNKAASVNADLPRILLSPIPLFRPEGTNCGPLRERRRGIFQGAGLNYQNLVDEDVSSWLLEKLRPAVVYSGDDHDHCRITHNTPYGRIPETSVKSFSMVMGVQRPGFLLLSLASSIALAPPTFDLTSDVTITSDSNKFNSFRFQNRAATHAETLCLLPDQIRIYTHLYLPFFLVTIFVIIVLRLRARSSVMRSAKALANGLPIHDSRHKKRLSQSLLGRRRVVDSNGDGDIEDHDPFVDPLTYPSTLQSPITSFDGGYSYHSPIETDDFYSSYDRDRVSSGPLFGHSRRSSRVYQNVGEPSWFERIPFFRRVIWVFKRNQYFNVEAGVVNEVMRDLWWIAWPPLLLYLLVWNAFGYL